MTVISIEVYAESRMELIDKLGKWMEILNNKEINFSCCRECGEELE
jgi:hypothetical protein